jgi:hypothetical protein
MRSFQGIRVEVVGSDDVDGCVDAIPRSPSLVVLFPDEFRLDQVVGLLFSLRRQRPDVHAVLVTGARERFAKIVVAADNAPPPSVVARPAGAWAILEAAARAAANDGRSITARRLLGGRSAVQRPHPSSCCVVEK